MMYKDTKESDEIIVSKIQIEKLSKLANMWFILPFISLNDDTAKYTTDGKTELKEAIRYIGEEAFLTLLYFISRSIEKWSSLNSDEFTLCLDISCIYCQNGFPQFIVMPNRDSKKMDLKDFFCEVILSASFQTKDLHILREILGFIRLSKSLSASDVILFIEMSSLGTKIIERWKSEQHNMCDVQDDLDKPLQIDNSSKFADFSGFLGDLGVTAPFLENEITSQSSIQIDAPTTAMPADIGVNTVDEPVQIAKVNECNDDSASDYVDESSVDSENKYYDFLLGDNEQNNEISEIEYHNFDEPVQGISYIDDTNTDYNYSDFLLSSESENINNNVIENKQSDKADEYDNDDNELSEISEEEEVIEESSEEDPVDVLIEEVDAEIDDTECGEADEYDNYDNEPPEISEEEEVIEESSEEDPVDMLIEEVDAEIDDAECGKADEYDNDDNELSEISEEEEVIEESSEEDPIDVLVEEKDAAIDSVECNEADGENRSVSENLDSVENEDGSNETKSKQFCVNIEYDNYESVENHTNADKPNLDFEDLYSSSSSTALTDAPVSSEPDKAEYHNVYLLPSSGEIIAVAKSSFVIGRDKPSCDLYINNIFISRRHAEITLSKNGVFLEDLNSTNSTHLNGCKLKPHTKYPLKNSDKITFGRSEYLCRILEI